MIKKLAKFIGIAIVSAWMFHLSINGALAATNDATVEVLGGGGGGGVIGGQGGGGGGGGEYHRCTETLSVQSYTVTVGAGGSEDNNPTTETDSSFVGTGISITADGGDGSANATAGTAGTGGTVTECDVGPTTFAGGTPGKGLANGDTGGGAGGGAGFGGKGGNGADSSTTVGGGGGGGAGETAEGGAASGATAGSGGAGGGGGGGAGGDGAAGGNATGGTPATYQIVGGGGGGGGDDTFSGGSCGAPGGGSGGGEVTGAGNGCRGEVRIIYVDTEIDATGGTETTSGSFRIHTFTANGTFTVNSITISAVPTLEQAAYTWYSNSASTSPGNAGTINTPMTAPSQGTPFRLRLNLHVKDAELAVNGTTTKLQFATKVGTSACRIGGSESYSDLTTATAIRFFNNASLADNLAIGPHPSFDPRHSSTTAGSKLDNAKYQNFNDGGTDTTFTNAQSAIPIDEDGIWDFSLTDFSAAANTSFCIRAVQNGGGLLASYGSSTLPELRTAQKPKVRLRGTVILRTVRLR